MLSNIIFFKKFTFMHFKWKYTTLPAYKKRGFLPSKMFQLGINQDMVP